MVLTLKSQADYSGFKKAVKMRMLEVEIGSVEEIAGEMGVSTGALRSWIKDPGTFRLRDFVKFLDVLKLEEEERSWYIEEIQKQERTERRAV